MPKSCLEESELVLAKHTPGTALTPWQSHAPVPGNLWCSSAPTYSSSLSVRQIQHLPQAKPGPIYGHKGTLKCTLAVLSPLFLSQLKYFYFISSPAHLEFSFNLAPYGINPDRHCAAKHLQCLSRDSLLSLPGGTACLAGQPASLAGGTASLVGQPVGPARWDSPA